MKIQIKALLLMIAVFCANGLFAQTIGLNGSAAIFESGSVVTFEATGETANKRIVTVSVMPATTHYNVDARIWETKYFPQDSKPGKFQYKIENRGTTQLSVKLIISTTIIIISNGTISYEYKDFNFDITVGPKRGPAIQNNVIAFASGDPTFFDDFMISGTTPTGGDGTYSYEWQLVDDNNIGSSFSGTRSSLNSLEKDNTNEPPIIQENNVYLRRKITSGTQVSYSNRILIFDYTNANKNELVVKVKGRVYRKDANGTPIKVDDEINLKYLLGNYFLGFNPNNMNPETTFRLENPVNGVRYKWYYYSYVLVGKSTGIAFNTPIYQQYGPPPRYFIRLHGSDGSKGNYGLYTVFI